MCVLEVSNLIHIIIKFGTIIIILIFFGKIILCIQEEMNFLDFVHPV